MYKQRLELDWIGKDEEPKLEPRVLIKGKSIGDDSGENILVHGDNLLALKALESEYTAKVKAVFIDPPYNTGSAFAQYDDGIEHSLWLSLIRDRLSLLRRLLTDDGSIWISIDDNECHYLKVLCDEVFGRTNFVSAITWLKRVSPANDAKYFSSDHDYILVYAKNKSNWKPNRLPRGEAQNAYYKNPDNDTRGPWNSVTYTGNKTKIERPNLYYGINNPFTNKTVYPPDNLTWRYGKDTHEKNEAAKLLYWGKDGKSNVPRMKMFLHDAEPIVPRSVWHYDEAGSTQSAMNEQKKLFTKPFATPKPELLLSRIVHISTNPGDLVLDSFAGSGTTGAVAHKMNRNWIMVELGEHCFTHIVPRLEQVVSGTDGGGISDQTNWKGGGGFSVYELAPSLLQKDPRGNWIIGPKYNAALLANAVCKHEGFKFWPDSKTYWKQGHSSEKDFIFVTTEFLTSERLDKIASQLKPDESLLVCAKAFKVAKTKYPNITIKKIPQMLLGRCESGAPPNLQSTGSGTISGSGHTHSISASGSGTETYPANIALNYIIKL